jgi:hypothetical protein
MQKPTDSHNSHVINLSAYRSMYIALVRRLVEIADDARPGKHMDRVMNYDKIARAHQQTLRDWDPQHKKENDEPLSSPLR